MLTQVEVERMPFYRLGMQQGMALGRGEGEAALLLRQLRRKFGPLPPEREQRIRDACPQTLALWGDRVLEAHTLKEVFS
uniref:DUF4351 domain-containing protein n=1 Tax=Candidatus Kentrum sp. DK TaxID=2126562 RepID=A0A450T9P0_9GAMM|nr:MAG: protein of unknown function (DUF4351) [Candidatus Kentron sp. DK]